MRSIQFDIKLPALVIILSIGLTGACSDEADNRDPGSGDTRVAQCDDLLVLTAMPAELAPLLDAVDVTDTFLLDQRIVYGAKRGGHQLWLAMTGIGLVNAAEMTSLALENFPVRAVVFSGVAGSTHRIGDVVIADRWLLADNSEPRPVDGRLLHAARATAELTLPFQRCTPYPLDPPGRAVCLAQVPHVIIGGTGHSADPFGGRRLACIPGGDDVFGCAPANAPDGEPIPLMSGSAPAALAIGTPAAGDAGEPLHTVQLEDMESAMALAVASMFNVPAIAVRSVSDGTGDPLDLDGLFEQFFVYYRLASNNAALVTLALFDRITAECDRYTE